MRAAALLAALLLLAATAEAQRGPRDPRELETFLDGAVPALLESYDVPGLVISVVANGRTLLAKPATVLCSKRSFGDSCKPAWFARAII
jgi:hypothetical protein